MELFIQEKQIDQQLQNLLNKKMKDFENQIKKQLPLKISNIKSEIYGIYKNMVQNIVTQTFYEYYKNNVDMNSVLNSIGYVSINDFRPDFYYNINKVLFRESEQGRYIPFNDNAQKWGKNIIKKQSYLEDLYQDLEDFETNENNIYENKEELLSYIENQMNLKDSEKIKRERDIKEYITVKEVFEKSKVKFIREFNKEYDIHIKPMILKKYGIKIG